MLLWKANECLPHRTLLYPPFMDHASSESRIPSGLSVLQAAKVPTADVQYVVQVESARSRLSDIAGFLVPFSFQGLEHHRVMHGAFVKRLGWTS